MANYYISRAGLRNCGAQCNIFCGGPNPHGVPPLMRMSSSSEKPSICVPTNCFCGEHFKPVSLRGEQEGGQFSSKAPFAVLSSQRLGTEDFMLEWQIPSEGLAVAACAPLTTPVWTPSRCKV